MPTRRTVGEQEHDRPTSAEVAQTEFLEALRGAEATTPLVEPSEDEARNGWTAEGLTAYLAEQQAAQSLRIDPRSAMNRQGRRPAMANSKYRPHRWRG